MKIFVASFNRASDGAIKPLVDELRSRDMLANIPEYATHILAVGDRSETYDCVLEHYRKNVPIIHLWSGEKSDGTHDEVYRHSMTLMSMMQLCTNDTAMKRTESLCASVGKESNAYTIGNIMLDDLSIDNSIVPNEKYILILYNPNTLCREKTKEDINQINDYLHVFSNLKTIWIEPNGDPNSDLVMEYVTHKNLPRPQFLALIKNCSAFVTNSSCQYYEAQFLIDESKIKPIGERNSMRESKISDMSIKGATKRTINILETLL